MRILCLSDSLQEFCPPNVCQELVHIFLRYSFLGGYPTLIGRRACVDSFILDRLLDPMVRTAIVQQPQTLTFSLRRSANLSSATFLISGPVYSIQATVSNIQMLLYLPRLYCSVSLSLIVRYLYVRLAPIDFRSAEVLFLFSALRQRSS